jgi:hypothetical protein
MDKYLEKLKSQISQAESAYEAAQAQLTSLSGKINGLKEALEMYAGAKLVEVRPQPASPTRPVANTKALRAAIVETLAAGPARGMTIGDIFNKLVAKGVVVKRARVRSALYQAKARTPPLVAYSDDGYHRLAERGTPARARTPTKGKKTKQNLGNQPSQRRIIIDAAVQYLRHKGGRAPTPEMLEDFEKKGISVSGKDKVGTISSYLSQSPLFDNIRGEGYGLTEWDSEYRNAMTETPDSGKLSGAPNANGGWPLSS